MKCQTGLGLIELLLGLVLIGVLASFALPAFAELIDAQQRRDAALQLAHSLRSARTEALLRSQPVWVEAIADDWSQGWRIHHGDERDEQSLLIERARNGKPRIVGNTNIRNRVGFSAYGTPLQIGNGTLSMCLRDQARSHYQVIVAPNGRVRVEGSKRAYALCG